MGLVCVVCGDRADGLCGACRKALEPASPDVPGGLTSMRAMFVYEGVGRDLLGRLKFDNRRAPLRPLARALQPSLPDVDLVVPVPVLPDRRRDRGYSLPDLFASAVARGLGRPKRNLVRRTDHLAQQGRGRTERLAGTHHRAGRTRARRVLLVDDVITTGGTLASCASALHAVGVTEVHGVVLAATPG